MYKRTDRKTVTHTSSIATVTQASPIATVTQASSIATVTQASSIGYRHIDRHIHTYTYTHTHAHMSYVCTYYVHCFITDLSQFH